MGKLPVFYTGHSIAQYANLLQNPVQKLAKDFELAKKLAFGLVCFDTNEIIWIKKQKNDGIIEITARLEDKFIVVTVNDNGTGVLEELKERIFEPGVTTKIGGFGMGLVVANELIASHGGYLKNIQPGYLGGATFEMSLPIHKGEITNDTNN